MPDEDPVPTAVTVPIVDIDSVSVPRGDVVVVAHVERVVEADARRVVSAEYVKIEDRVLDSIAL